MITKRFTCQHASNIGLVALYLFGITLIALQLRSIL